jgi:hypothetical protein
VALKPSVAALAVWLCCLLVEAAPAHAQIVPEGFLVGALGGSPYMSDTSFGVAAGAGARFGPYLGAGVEGGFFRAAVVVDS